MSDEINNDLNNFKEKLEINKNVYRTAKQTYGDFVLEKINDELVSQKRNHSLTESKNFTI